MKRALAWLGFIAVLLLVELAVLHTRAVRAHVLAWIIARLERTGVAFQAERLDYNLFGPSVDLHRVSLATTARPADPFFTCEEAHLVFGWTILRGRIDLERVDVTRPRISLLRDAAGVNWPGSSGHVLTSPTLVRLGFLHVTDLGFVWRDEQTASTIQIPSNAETAGGSIDLAPTSGGAAGPIRMAGSGQIRWRDHDVALNTIEGRLSWDARNLSVNALRIATSAGVVQVDGRADDLLGTTRLDARLTIDADLAAIASSVSPGRRVAGMIRVDTFFKGPTGSLETTLHVAGRNIVADRLEGIAIDASGRVLGDTAELATLTARVLGGSLSARGRMSLGEGPGVVHLDWQQLDLAALTRGVTSAVVVPAADTRGSLDAQWSAPHIEGLRVRAEGWTVPHHAAGLPLEGPITIDLRGQRWMLRAEQTIADSARAVVDVGGALDARKLSDSSVAGTIHVSMPDFVRLAESDGLAQLTGLGGDAPAMSGAADADLNVTGTFGTPRIGGRVDAVNVRYGSLPRGVLHTRVSAMYGEVRVDDIEGRMGASSVSGQLRIGSKDVAGRLDASLRDVGDFSSLFPATVHPQGSAAIGLNLSGSMASLRVGATVASNDLVAAGQRVDRLDAALSAHGRVITLDRLQVRSGDGRLDAHGSVDLAHEKYAMDAAIEHFPIRPVTGATGEVMAPLKTSVAGEVNGEGALSALAGHGKFSLADTRWADADLGRLDVTVAAARRTISVEMRAPDLALTATLDLGIDPDGLLSVHGRWEPNDLATLSHRLGWTPPAPLTGSAALGVDVSGRRDRPKELKLTFDLERLNLDADRRPIRLAQPARVQYDGHTLDVRDLKLTSGGSTLSAEGLLGRSASPGLALAFDGLIGDVAFVSQLIRPRAVTSEHGEPSGALALRLNATGPLTRPIVSGSMRVTDGRLPLTNETAVTDIGLDASYDTGVLAVNRLGAAFQGATLEASGRVPADLLRGHLSERWRDLLPQTGGQAELKAQVASVTPRVAVPFIDAAALSEIGGQVDASVELQADRASLDQVRGSVTLNRAELSLSGVSFDQQTPTRLVLNQGRVNIANWEWGLSDNRVTLSGGMMLGGERVIDVTAGAALDLRLLNAFTRAARTTGRADSTVHVGGALGAPTLDGYVTIANGGLRLASPRVVLNDLTGTITLARDSFTLEQLSATLNGGETTIAGTVHHKWFRELDGQITLRSRSAALDVSGLRAETDADLAFNVGGREPLVSGTVTLVRSAYREPLSLTSGLLRALQTSSDSLQSGPPSWLDSVRLDVRVLTGDNLIVDNNYAQLAATSDVRIVGTATQPGLVGRATLAEGGLVFFGGNRYRLADQGTIDFVNPTQVEPDLNLRAVTQVQGTEITLVLKGTPATLQTSLTSPEWKYSQGDLLSLLVTGRSANEAAAGGFAPGSEELLGYVSGELFGAAGRAVGLDVVRIERGTPDVRFDAGLVATETDPAARLTFGKNIGRDVQVVFSQSLRQSGGLTWIVSYAPRSRIELRAVSLDDGNRLYDFRHDLSFGGPVSNRARAPAPDTLKVATIHIIGAGTDEAVLRGRLKVTAGDRFSFFRWQDDRDRLEAFYEERDHLEARVATRRVLEEAVGSSPARVELTYEVRPGAHTTVAVVGFSFPRSVISALKTEWTHAVVDDFLAEQAATIARGELVDRGFVSASVVARVAHPSSDEKRLEITTNPGPRTNVRRVMFRGNRHVPTERLLQAIADAELTRAVWLEPDRVRDTVRTFYRREGYLNASVFVEAIEIEGNTARRTVSVEEGEQFRIREIRVEGAHASSADDVRTLSALSDHAFSETAIDFARRAIDRNYRARGFNNVGITLRTEALADRSEVNVAINIEEGPEQRLRDVVVSGLTQTKPSVVDRALKLKVGEPVNRADWYRARQRLYETGVFRNVDIEPELMAAPTDAAPGAPGAIQEQPIRAKVTLEESPPLRLRYGLELNDEQTTASDAAVAFESAGQSGRTLGVGLAGDASTRSLFGLGISAGLAGRYTRDFRAARVYLTSAWLLGLPITSNVFVSRSRQEVGSVPDTTAAAFVTDKTDLTFEQRVRPAAKMELSWRYTFERNHTFALHPDPTFPFDISVNIAALASSAIIDRRNDLVDATRGWFHSSNLEYGAPSLGSDLHFIKYLIQQRYYRPVGRVVFAGSIRLGLANSFEQSLIPSERFFAGGGNSVRGYLQDALSPRDFLGDAVGGNALFVWNGEVRFPIVKILRGVGFLDAGRAFDTVAHLALRDLPAGAGAGLRIQTPVVLIRVDYGVPLDSAFGPRHGRWFFSIGQAF